MRFQSRRLFGLAVAVLTTVGCAAKQPASNDSQLWSWEPAPQASSNRQYGLSVSNAQRQTGGTGLAGAAPDEFNFSHPRVDDFVTRFTTDLRGFYSNALERSGRYVPRMSSILQKEGVPQELAYLPLIESGFRTHAVSRAGAVGPWQLIPGTGRRYGLRIDRYVDERRDPVKSTQAAARYLKDLYAMFGDWHLSLAAYNTGEGNISRILEAGRAGDFWEMSDRGYLYQETEDFVPEFLAALHIAEQPEAYGFPAPDHERPHYDLVTVKRPLALTTVAKLSGASLEEIKDLNPALQRGMVPPTGYAVRLPKGSKEQFEVALASYVEPKPKPSKRAVVRRGKRSPHGRGTKHKHATKAVAKASSGHGGRKVASVKGARGQVAQRAGAPVMTASHKGRGRVLD